VYVTIYTGKNYSDGNEETYNIIKLFKSSSEGTDIILCFIEAISNDKTSGRQRPRGQSLDGDTGGSTYIQYNGFRNTLALPVRGVSDPAEPSRPWKTKNNGTALGLIGICHYIYIYNIRLIWYIRAHTHTHYRPLLNLVPLYCGELTSV